MNKIIQGDCLEEMKKLPDNSVDTLITDPPYGLSFMGKKWDYDVPSEEIWKECLRVLKPGGTALIFAGSRTQHRMAVRVEDAGFILKDTIMWLYGSGFPKATDISKQLDKGHEREIISKQKRKGRSAGILGKEVDIIHIESKPATPEAKLWNGWKSHGLKPAYEPILVAIKPNDGSYANNALKWGVSGLNIDGGRINFKNKEDEKESKGKNQHSKYPKSIVKNSAKNGIYHPDNRPPEDYNPTGRFPANIIISEDVAPLIDEQSGVSKSSSNSFKANDYQEKETNTPFTRGDFIGKGDKGGASRFFKNIPLDSRIAYIPKASKSERNAGLDELEEKQMYKEDGSGNSLEIFGSTDGGRQPRKNFHPTVKPLKLMEYLCTLTKTPTGGIVLDPFAGSGTTGVACINTGRDFILIEREEEYIPIIEARIKHAQKEKENKLF